MARSEATEAIHTAAAAKVWIASPAQALLSLGYWITRFRG
jgi:hypothetical protein